MRMGRVGLVYPAPTFEEKLVRGILKTMFNKSFYKFFFGFLAVLASTLLVILVVGSQGV